MDNLIPDAHRAHVEARLAGDLIAWLTTVRSAGMPDTVPVWFIRTGDELITYSRPDRPKLRNIAEHPQVSFVLDDTRGGGDVVRFEATARVADDRPAADQLPDYVAKYGPHIRGLSYGDPSAFAADYSVPIVITPTRFRR